MIISFDKDKKNTDLNVIKMETMQSKKNMFDDYLGCSGEYNNRDIICLKHCALNVECAIECNRSTNFDLLEELFFYEDKPMSIH